MDHGVLDVVGGCHHLCEKEKGFLCEQEHATLEEAATYHLGHDEGAECERMIEGELHCQERLSERERRMG